MLEIAAWRCIPELPAWPNLGGDRRLARNPIAEKPAAGYREAGSPDRRGRSDSDTVDRENLNSA